MLSRPTASSCRQAVSSRNSKIAYHTHEPPGGPSRSPGGFWKFPESQENPIQMHRYDTNNIHYSIKI